MTHRARARRVLDLELAALRAVRGRLDGSFDVAVERVLACLAERGKLVLVGIGKSGHIAAKLAATFTSTGAPGVLLHSVDALHGDLGVIADRDLVLALSYSGETEELVGLLPALRRAAAGLIAMTGAPRSALARHSDLVLDVRVPREACPFNLAPTSSTTAMLALGDALAVAVMQARGFRARDFARHHPAGAIGRALLLKVADIMRTGPRHPVVRATATVQEALLEMTRAKAGSVAVTDVRGRLAGVFTDGDLRRHLSAGEDILQRPLAEVMTRRPVTVRADALAAEALKIFNDRQVDDLIAVDGRRRPVGLVDLQDLPRLKLM